jgi:hypothetical protein
MNHDSCCICLDSFNRNSNNIKLMCDHTLHDICLFKYIKSNFKKNITFNTCPICRRYISTNFQINNPNYIINNKNLSFDKYRLICMLIVYYVHTFLIYKFYETYLKSN